MTVQFEAINPRTQELNFNKVRLERLEENTLNLIPGAQVGPGGGGGEGDAPLQRGGDGGVETGNHGPDIYTRQATPISMSYISLNFQVLLPSLTCAVVSLGDRSRLEALQGYQGDLSAG